MSTTPVSARGDHAVSNAASTPPACRLLYLSSLPARDAFGGAVVMQRHFQRLGENYEVHRAHYAPPLAGETNYHVLPPARLYWRLFHSRLHRHAVGLDHAFGLFHSRRAMRDVVAKVRPHLILTVAEGTLFGAVRSVTRAARIPLASVFHDWAPGWPDIPAGYRAATERSFRRIHRESDVAFCVSEEMRAALGPKENALLLPPIPAPHVATATPRATAPAESFHALYAGTFRLLYSAEVKALCRAAAESGKAHLLRLTGPDPQWTGADAERLARKGLYLGFLDRDALQTQLATAGVLLVICSFDPAFALYSRYSFPSKITEYCQQGRPLLLWGPEDSAAVKWARRSQAAFVVTDPNPAAVLAAVEQLAAAPALRTTLAAQAQRCAAEEFDPARLQRIFEDGLNRATAATPQRDR